MNVLLLSAYDAQSHVYWRERLIAMFNDIQWHVLALPPRYFNWRIRGNPLSWGAEPDPTFSQQFDLCIATSMVDLATLRGLVPTLSSIPSLLYFHENQFAYPVDREVQSEHSLAAQMVQLYSAICAQKLAFNSEYNRASFLDGVDSLLTRLPDKVPSGIVPALSEKSLILPVPIKPAQNIKGSSRDRKSFVWNHRWQYDKSPHRLLALLQALPCELSVTFHVVGQSFRKVPAVFNEINSLLEQRGWLGRWGFIEDRDEYHLLLERCEFVLSTADHDFQGIAVLEAIAAGCVPILPDRLAYREIVPQAYRYASHQNTQTEAKAMADKVKLLLAQSLAVPDIGAYAEQRLVAQYQRVIDELVGEDNV